jgi:hypothetical protein
MLPILAFILLLNSNAKTEEKVYTVDVIELNTKLNDDDTPCFEQYIFWVYNPEYRRLDVTNWLLKDEIRSGPYIVGEYTHIRFRFNKTNFIVRSKIFRITESKEDPERENKKLTNEKYRVRIFPKKLNHWE